jgi:hypothetical protein
MDTATDIAINQLKMTYMPTLKKKALCAFFLMLSSCTTPPHWEYQSTYTCTPAFNSGRMTLSEIDDLGQVEIELDRGTSGLRMYVNISSVPISTEDGLIAVTTVINAQSSEEKGTILTGGQRILLGDNTRDRIIEALLNGENVHLSFLRYRACIIPDKFPDHYVRLLSIPI